jgi:L-asparaginase II
VAVVSGMQEKIGLTESDLMCGAHIPADTATWEAMLLRGEKPTPRRHNCSGKHTGMLAHALLRGLPKADYINPNHPVQQTILQVFAEMTGMAPSGVVQGIDGCSVPTFAIPLYNTALGFARLADPAGLPERRAAALRHIFAAMSSHPDMVAASNAFDTLLMLAGTGGLVSKHGAEGYQGIAVAPGLAGPNAPGFGIAFKVADGDADGRACPTLALALLKQLGVLSAAKAEQLARFDRRPLRNYRRLEVGEIRACFAL